MLAASAVVPGTACGLVAWPPSSPSKYCSSMGVVSFPPHRRRCRATPVCTAHQPRCHLVRLTLLLLPALQPSASCRHPAIQGKV